MTQAAMIQDAVKQVIASTFNLAAEQVPDDAAAGSLAGWDSLAQLELMLALEARFGVRIPAAQMLELHSLPQIVDYLQEQGAAA